ncbi:glycosyltransferase family 2 protein [Solitalea koreensis]|uniref:Glycosyltransferase 2-like domain-containing protein n=1 Tax=Solitalea koreensis TaxID=543615 RepID=A0A521CSA9_9SPHI|nr:glycosyltransferase family 2 protein [Solitalea koreensis]SMO61530.1 hypothetical protein SAMN06265350_104260 [Solitalea koreensis]
MKTTASIVLYNNNVEELTYVVSCVLKCKFIDKLYLIDNSPKSLSQSFRVDERIEFIFNNANLGYGKAHNIAIQKSKGLSKYHLILNPDISFSEGTLESIYNFMEQNPDVGQLMPKILYNDGEIQRLCKLLPTPFDLIGRRFFKHSGWAQKRNQKYELCGFSYDKIINTPCLSGCFMFFRNEILQESGGFDPRYFMYLEDYDLTRRVHKLTKTIFYPEVQVFHGFKKESYSNPVLLKHHIRSAIKYFNKWGWVWDKDRDELNKQILRQVS